MIPYLRFLAGKERTRSANRHLGFTLAFVAGAVNAGGFLAAAQYTSHITGVLSSIADNLALGEFHAVLAGLAAFLSFVSGAATSSLLINWTRRKGLHSQYALPLMVEAALLSIFGVLGANLSLIVEVFVPLTVLLLCFIMGLQNAMITKLSEAEIRTTHMTGNATDLGIEFGKLIYWNRDPTMQHQVVANREKLSIHASLILLFVTGGVLGAQGFKKIGFNATIPLAFLLFFIAAVPVLDDMRPILGGVRKLP